MGLAGRKEKQRIGNDPRNLTWADDAAKFGQSYLSKFGWDPSQGLGLQGDGRTSHIKVAQKLNLMGIGAGSQQAGPEGIAWKQNRDYELLLKRLNESSATPEERSNHNTASDDYADGAGSGSESGLQMKRKSQQTDAHDDGSTKKKRKKSKNGEESKSEKRAKKKKSKTAQDSDQNNADNNVVDATTITSTAPKPVFTPRPMAHRARFLKSKRLAGMNAAAMSEILGVAPSTPGSSSATPADIDSHSSTPPTPQRELPLEQLSTSSKSVADYFKEKLAARNAHPCVSSPPTPSSDRDDGDSTRFGLGARPRQNTATEQPRDDEDDRPRRGLGSPLAVSPFQRFTPATNFAPALASEVPPAPTPQDAKATETTDQGESKDIPKKCKKQRDGRAKDKKLKEEHKDESGAKPEHAVSLEPEIVRSTKEKKPKNTPPSVDRGRIDLQPQRKHEKKKKK